MNKNVDAVNHREFQQFFHDTQFDTLREMKMKEIKGLKKNRFIRSIEDRLVA